jgi:bifunctional ADP-heptose synthase (sugar kinase/adenylyltransferase)
VPLVDDTPEEAIAAIRPDVVFKGSEYAQGKAMPEADLVRGYGGAVEFVPMTPGLSTTALAARSTGAGV